jgi:hypothetical protein
MTPSALVCCFIFTACLMAGTAAGEWVAGAVAGVIGCILFIVILGSGE